MKKEYQCTLVENDEDFMDLVSKIETIAQKHGLAKKIKWGQYDVWNDYNKVVLASFDEIKADAAEHGWDQIYAGIVYPEGKPALRTGSTPKHYSVQYNETKHLEIFYDDMGEVTYEKDTPWGSFVKETLELLKTREVVE